MKIKHSLTGTLTILTLTCLLFYSCEKEDSITNEEIRQEIGVNFQTSFNKELFIYNIPTGFKVQWDTAKKVYSEFFESEVTEFKIAQTSKSKETNTTKIFINYHLIAKKQNDTYSFYIASYNSYSDINEKISLNNVENYTGAILISGTKNTKVASIWYNKGILTEPNVYDKRPDNYDDLDDDGGGGGGGRWISIRVQHYTDNYKGGNGMVGLEYTGTTYHGETYETVWDSDASYNYYRSHPQYTGANDAGTPNHNGTGGNVRSEVKTLDKISNRNESFNDNVVITTTNPCVRGVLSVLRQKDSGGSLNPDIKPEARHTISSFILEVLDGNPNYTVDFKIKQLGNNSEGHEVNGKTVIHNRLSSTIYLDSDLVSNGTRLFMAQTLIHESMHAYFLSQYSIPTGTNIVNALSDLYLKYKESHNENESRQLAQHEFISQYVDGMAHSLSAWDGHKQDFRYYKQLSWGGLETSSAYEKLKVEDQRKIQKVINNERYGHRDAKGIKCM